MARSCQPIVGDTAMPYSWKALEGLVGRIHRRKAAASQSVPITPGGDQAHFLGYFCCFILQN